MDAKKLLEDLMDFDKDNIPDKATCPADSADLALGSNPKPYPAKVIQTIGPYIDREDFDPAAIKKASRSVSVGCMMPGDRPLSNASPDYILPS